MPDLQQSTKPKLFVPEPGGPAHVPGDPVLQGAGGPGHVQCGEAQGGDVGRRGGDDVECVGHGRGPDPTLCAALVQGTASHMLCDGGGARGVCPGGEGERRESGHGERRQGRVLERGGQARGPDPTLCVSQQRVGQLCEPSRNVQGVTKFKN